MSEYAPVDKVRYEAGKPGNPVTLNLLKRHVNVLRGDLLGGIVERLREVAGSVRSFRSLAKRSAQLTCFIHSISHSVNSLGRKFI